MSVVSRFLSQYFDRSAIGDKLREGTSEGMKGAPMLQRGRPVVFDRYVSLGCNCEVGFQLKRVRGVSESGFFTWNITEPAALVSLLENDFSGILSRENLTLHEGGHLMHDASHDFMVHHSFDPVAFKDAPDFDKKLVELRGKFQHFVNKFRQNAAEPGRIAYFYKGSLKNPQGFALQVHALLKRYHRQNPFSLIVLQSSDHHMPDWGLPGIHNRYLKRFSPYSDTPDAHVPSWDAIFREFPHRKPLHLANY